MFCLTYKVIYRLVHTFNGSGRVRLRDPSRTLYLKGRRGDRGRCTTRMSPLGPLSTSREDGDRERCTTRMSPLRPQMSSPVSLTYFWCRNTSVCSKLCPYIYTPTYTHVRSSKRQYGPPSDPLRGPKFLGFGNRVRTSELDSLTSLPDSSFESLSGPAGPPVKWIGSHHSLGAGSGLDPGDRSVHLPKEVRDHYWTVLRPLYEIRQSETLSVHL